jgi:hypothetical protein
MTDLPDAAQAFVKQLELERERLVEGQRFTAIDPPPVLLTPLSTDTPYHYIPTLKPATVLLLGAVGTGKTYSLASWIKAGKSLRVLFTDPGGEESLLDAIMEQKLPIDNVHWTYVAPASTDWKTMEEVAQRITMSGYEDLAKEKFGLKKDKYRQFYQLLSSLSNFVCARTGEHLGAVDSWGSDCVFALDSTTGLNQIAKDLVVGAKPAPHMGEWMTMMDCEERLLNKLTSDCHCYVVVTAHPEKVMNEQAGIPMFNAALLGSKLAPRVPRMFSDVILARKDGDQFWWSTVAPYYDLKSRNLPLRDRLPPSFEGVVASVNRRQKFIEDAGLVQHEAQEDFSEPVTEPLQDAELPSKPPTERTIP